MAVAVAVGGAMIVTDTCIGTGAGERSIATATTTTSTTRQIYFIHLSVWVNE